MVTEGMDRIFISVSSLEDSLAFYRDWVGMEVVADETPEPDEIKQLWNLPGKSEARAVLLKNELQSTLLELIEFTPRSGRKIREGVGSLDQGLYDVAFLVRDIEGIYQELTGKGYTFVSPPIGYQPNWVPHQVKEVILIGPDGVRIVHFQRMKEEDYGSQGNYVKLNHSAQIVNTTDEAVKFYCGILGLDLLGQMTAPKGAVQDILAIPQDTEVNLAFVNSKDADTLQMECIQLSLDNKSLAQIARPPNLGLFMISFKVDNLSSLVETLKRNKVAILSGPVELHTRLRGKIRAITVEGPGGTMVELFEQ